MTGTLYVVATPIGNLSDISPRALDVLRSVRLILAEDTRHSKRLLQRYSIDVPTLSFHKFNERTRAGQVIRQMLEEQVDVAVISDAGTPCISDPGGEIVRLAREDGIPVIGVSGPSAIITAVSVSGLPAAEFTFLGFLPRERGGQKEAFQAIRQRKLSTFVVYESPLRIRALAAALAEEFPQAKVCFCCELTKIHERSYYGGISDVAAQLESDPVAERGEYTVVVHVGHGEQDERGEGHGLALAGPDGSGQPSSDSAPGLEALLVDAMVKHGWTLKQAVSGVVSEAGIPRNEVYRASLRLKSLFGGSDDDTGDD